MRCYGRLFLFTVLTALCACGGGSAPTAITTVPQTNPTFNAPSGVAQSVPLGLQPTTVALPSVTEITGTLFFPAVGTPTTITLNVSATAPPGVALEAVRHAQSHTLTVYEYVTIVSPKTLSLPNIPAMTFHFPAKTPLAGKYVYYGISDLDAAGGRVSFNTEGPGTIDAQTVVFGQIPTTITFQAGHTYTFVLYSTGTAPTQAAATKIYVVSQGSSATAKGSVTTYTADGRRTTPTITAGLANAISVAVDTSGKIYVANYGNSTVTTYKPDGTQTTPTIAAGLDMPVSVAIDAAGKIYVANSGNNTVTTYTSDGLRTSPTIAVSGADPSAYPQGLAVDPAGEIHVLLSGYSVQTYRANGSATTPTISVGLNDPAGIALDAAGRIFVADLGTLLFGSYINSDITIFNPDGTQSTAPVITAGLDKPVAVAVDAAGKIYVVNGTQTSNGSVTTYNADGSPATPTITAGIDNPISIAVH